MTEPLQPAQPAELYLVRWRFDFADSKPSRWGQWNRQGDLQKDMAAFVDKTGLRRAAVEGKNILTRAVTPLAECDGWDFVNFEWLQITAFSSSRPSAGSFHKIVGLSLKTRDLITHVLTTGEVGVEARPDEDKTFHYAGFGR